MKRSIIQVMRRMFASATVHGDVKLKTYSGLYKGGKATYTYYENREGERMRHGKFCYDRHTTNDGGRLIESYRLCGTYKDNRKNGRWICRYHGSFGRRFTVEINFVDGKMEGWLKRKNTGDRLFMKNNRITGLVTLSQKTLNEQWTINGLFDDNGFPDGTWTKNYRLHGNLYTDVERYVHGLLVQQQTKNESTGRITKTGFDVDPQQYLDAHNPTDKVTVVGGVVCREEICFRQGERKLPCYHHKLLPEAFGALVKSIIEDIKDGYGYGSGQSLYEGIPFREIVIVT